MRLEKQNLPFWQTTGHLYGCYGAIFLCLFSLFNFIFHGWFSASFWGYLIGRSIYFIYNNLKQFPTSNPALYLEESTPPQLVHEKIPFSKIIEPEQKLLDDFLRLQYQIQNLIPIEANILFQDIHSLIIIITQKLKRSKDLNTQNELLKIQKIINDYLEPTINSYKGLPVIFLDRKIENHLSPNELIHQQLQLIHDELLEITQYVFQDDLNNLVQHGEFLQQKLKPPQFFKVGKDLTQGN